MLRDLSKKVQRIKDLEVSWYHVNAMLINRIPPFLSVPQIAPEKNQNTSALVMKTATKNSADKTGSLCNAKATNNECAKALGGIVSIVGSVIGTGIGILISHYLTTSGR
jgi:hypothetical protein